MRKSRTAFDSLLAYQRQTVALEQVAGLLEWDQDTMMPNGSAGQRAEVRGALKGVIHARRVSAEFSDLLEDAAAGPLDEFGSACIRKMMRERDLAVRVPKDLVVEIERVSAGAAKTWEDARARNDFGVLLPALERLVRLKRLEARAISTEGNAYNALLDRYEQGATTEWLDAVFGRLRSGLVDLRERVFSANRDVAALSGRFPEDVQIKLSREVATVFGYDWNRGRLDKSLHPFSSGSGNDVRITTRVCESDPFNCLYSTIHETGHACYEQGIRSEYLLTPLGEGASFGVHESQSRLYENQLGRSSAFCSWLFGRMTQYFGEIGVEDPWSFYSAVNRVSRGFIRTESDEVQYNLHIMLRYGLERDLIDGAIEAGDLEEAWNRRFLADFGFEVDVPSNGILQDIHWPYGLFGYFPTYAVGNIYAASLHGAMRRDLPELDRSMATGNLGPATEWLSRSVQEAGSLHEPHELMLRATGEPVTEKPLLTYLEGKFGELYGV